MLNGDRHVFVQIVRKFSCNYTYCRTTMLKFICLLKFSFLQLIIGNIGRSPRQEDEYSLACIGQLTIGEHSFS